MLKFAIAAGLVLAGAYSAHAADLMIDEAPAATDTSLVNSSMYVQLLGGVAPEGEISLYYDGDFLDGTSTYLDGYAIAGTIGVVVMDGLSIEVDAMHTKRYYFNTNDESAYSTSLMGNLKYTLQLNEMFGVYAAAGLGLVHYEYTGFAHDYSGLGYQLIAGASVGLTDNISAIAEYRYQNTFEHAGATNGDDVSVQAPTSAVLLGVKLAF